MGRISIYSTNKIDVFTLIEAVFVLKIYKKNIYLNLTPNWLYMLYIHTYTNDVLSIFYFFRPRGVQNFSACESGWTKFQYIGIRGNNISVHRNKGGDKISVHRNPMTNLSAQWLSQNTSPPPINNDHPFIITLYPYKIVYAIIFVIKKSLGSVQISADALIEKLDSAGSWKTE